MSRCKPHLRIILCLAALSSSWVLEASAAISGAGSGGILPPPPPPPPPISEKGDSKIPSKSSTGEKSVDDGDNKQNEDVTFGGQIDAVERVWGPANDSFGRIVQQTPPGSLNSGVQQNFQANQPSESNERALPQRQGPSHDPLRLHQPPPSWDQHTRPPYHQQQQYSEQQYYQQYQRPPLQQQRSRQFNPNVQQFQRGPPSQYQQQQQSRQLTIHSRPSPVAPTSAAATAAAAKSSALRIFSMAKQKVQTGMDVVSEQLDATKVVSSVSSLTSRIGGIGSSIGPGGNRGLGGPGRRPDNVSQRHATGPRQMGGAAGQRMRPAVGQGPRSNAPQGIQNRRMPPQRMGPPPNQQPPKPRDSYAPPISQLYSLGQDGEVVTRGDKSDDEDGNTLKNQSHDNESQIQTIADLHEDTESDEEGEKDLDGEKMRSRRNEITEQLQSPMTGERPPFKKQQPGRPMRPRPPTNPKHPTDRRLPPSSITPSWPNNGGSTASSLSTQKRYTYGDDDDDDDYSIGSKIKSVIGSVPIPNVSKMFRGSKISNYDDGAWSDDEAGSVSSGGNFFLRRFVGSSYKNVKSSSIGTIPMTSGSGPMSPRRLSSTKASNMVNIPPPVAALLGNRETLLSPTSINKCTSIGRTQAMLDVVRLAFVVCAAREVLPSFIRALAVEVSETTLPTSNGLKMAIVSTVLSTLEGWAPFAVVAAILVSASDVAWIQPSLRAASTEAASEVEANALYSQLYLRLIAAMPIQKSCSSKIIGKTTKAQASRIASSARLHFFTMISIIYILMSTVVVFRPAGAAMLTAITSLAKLPVWRSRPIEWTTAWESAKVIGMDLFANLRSLVSTELDLLRLEPLRVGVVITLFGALMLVSTLPSMEKGRTNGAIKDNLDEDEKEQSTAGIWSNMGSSSASRLSLISSPRGVEGALEKFSPEIRSKLVRKKMKRRQDVFSYIRSLQPLLKQLMYSISAMLLLSIPLMIYFYVFATTNDMQGDGISFSFKHINETGWVALLDLTVLLVFVHGQVRYAARCAIDSTNSQVGDVMTALVRRLAETIAELQKISADSSSTADFQAMLTASPVKGLTVSDLWAAHSTRKAWAVKGANIQCRNGEVVMIIGDDGSGKSRLLTAISEHIFLPPKSARSTTYVRGSINIAGVDLVKWDRAQLQRRMGISLNDVRTVSDWASLMSGCSLEEILEPLPISGGARIGARERNSIGVAMKITGLSSSVLPRLPSKLSTVVSAYEDDLKPSPIRPPSFLLSPSEWSRVMLTKVLAQLISGNDNQSSSNKVAKCMIGSIILLDDATSLMREVDEANFITTLRSTGAAVLITTNRWASGRFADRIVVLENGSVVESGTHNDLISLGPERSLYARQWNALSSL
ncbi:hypothetical protein ACHAXS_011138 [Conticribra weissflogii]